MRLNAKRGSEQYQAINSFNRNCSYVRRDAGEVRVLSTAELGMIEIGQPEYRCGGDLALRFFGIMLAASRPQHGITSQPTADEGHPIACALAIILPVLRRCTFTGARTNDGCSWPLCWS